MEEFSFFLDPDDIRGFPMFRSAEKSRPQLLLSRPSGQHSRCEISVNLHIQSEYRKIRTRKTPYLDTFHAVHALLQKSNKLYTAIGTLKSTKTSTKTIAAGNSCQEM